MSIIAIIILFSWVSLSTLIYLYYSSKAILRIVIWLYSIVIYWKTLVNLFKWYKQYSYRLFCVVLNYLVVFVDNKHIFKKSQFKVIIV